MSNITGKTRTKTITFNGETCIASFNRITNRVRIISKHGRGLRDQVVYATYAEARRAFDAL